MDWINYTLFYLGDAPVLLIDIITSVLGLSCVFLAGRNSKYNFWVGYLYTFALFLMFFNSFVYSFFLGFNLRLFSTELRILSIALLRHVISSFIVSMGKYRF